MHGSIEQAHRKISILGYAKYYPGANLLLSSPFSVVYGLWEQMTRALKVYSNVISVRAHSGENERDVSRKNHHWKLRTPKPDILLWKVMCKLWFHAYCELHRKPLKKKIPMHFLCGGSRLYWFSSLFHCTLGSILHKFCEEKFKNILAGIWTNEFQSCFFSFLHGHSRTKGEARE